ncbi:XdhC family protein [Verrucomicrobium sp. BvORR106]|uniref:XdhC family protein n=1 Tax=Verrucomicrobium sp. BvORR106 TaxID=1403819 RepID=UPI0009DFD0E4|nr:XdhC family protein [Verrucomicrobium sp. BvORR106]
MMKELRQIIERVRECPGQAWALATLVETRGSTYRKPGARMLVDEQGTTLGVLSGGCLEEEIARHGLELIDGAAARVIEFDTRRLYGCDGAVRILVEFIPPAAERGNLLTELGHRVDHRGLCRLSSRYEGEELGTTLLAPDELVPERNGTFLHCVPLPVRLLLFGAGPEISPLLHLAQTLGWLTLQFTHATDLAEDFTPDAQTVALVMTHNFGRDLAVLHRLVPFQLPYVGLLGPRRRHQQLIGELLSLGASFADSLASLHAPAGLDLGSESPEEIALSIVSEVAAVLAQRHGGHLRDRAIPIHLADTAFTKSEAA